MVTQVQEQGLGPRDSAQLPQLLAVLRTMLSPLPKPTKQAAQPTSAVTAGLGLVHKHCSHSVTRCPNSFWGGYLQLVPRQHPPQAGWGCPGSLGVQSAVSMTAGLCSPDGSQKPIALRILYVLLSPGSRRVLMTDALPALESSLPLGSINTLISHTEPSQVSPCSSSSSYQRTSVYSRPVLYHS